MAIVDILGIYGRVDLQDFNGQHDHSGHSIYLSITDARNAQTVAGTILLQGIGLLPQLLDLFFHLPDGIVPVRHLCLEGAHLITETAGGLDQITGGRHDFTSFWHACLSLKVSRKLSLNSISCSAVSCCWSSPPVQSCWETNPLLLYLVLRGCDMTPSVWQFLWRICVLTLD